MLDLNPKPGFNSTLLVAGACCDPRGDGLRITSVTTPAHPTSAVRGD